MLYNFYANKLWLKWQLFPPHKKGWSASLWIQNPLPMHKTEIKILYMFSVGGAFYAWIEL